MATYDNAYSRVIAWLKILLPLAALGILSTLFMVADNVDPSQTLPYADVDVQELAREQRIGGPSFASVTSDGAAVTLSAETASADVANPTLVLGQTLRAKIETPDGARVEIDAATGTIDNKKRVANLTGGVTLTSSTGYTIQTDAVETNFDQTFVQTSGQVSAEGPMGSISAGNMVLTKDEESGKYLLVFKDRVKLIYQPQDPGDTK